MVFLKGLSKQEQNVLLLIHFNKCMFKIYLSKLAMG